jgi:hypothetical protein
MAISAYPCLPELTSALGRCPIPNARIRTMVLQVLESMNDYSSARPPPFLCRLFSAIAKVGFGSRADQLMMPADDRP